MNSKIILIKTREELRLQVEARERKETSGELYHKGSPKVVQISEQPSPMDKKVIGQIAKRAGVSNSSIHTPLLNFGEMKNMTYEQIKNYPVVIHRQKLNKSSRWLALFAGVNNFCRGLVTDFAGKTGIKYANDYLFVGKGSGKAKVKEYERLFYYPLPGRRQ